MRRILAVAIALAALLTIVCPSAFAGEAAAAYGGVWRADAGRVVRFLLSPADATDQAVVDALFERLGFTYTAAVTVEGLAGHIALSGDGESWGIYATRDALDAIARTLLWHDGALDCVYFTRNGEPYPASPAGLAGAPYMTADEAAYDANFDASGNYVDPQAAPPDGAPIDALPHVAARTDPPQDETALNTLAFGATDWLERIARAVGERELDFDGAPPAELAWRLIAAELRRAEGGAAFTPAQVTAAYDRQFAYGRVPATPPDGATIARGGDWYRLTAPGDQPAIEAVINDAMLGDEGDVEIDLTVLRDAEGGQSFTRNLRLSFAPDSGSAEYGMKLMGLTSLARPAAFQEASVVRAGDGAPLGGQPIAQLMDNDLSTGWPAGGEGALMLSGGVREVRGLMLTPMAGSGDIAEVRVTLSDGNIYEQAFDDGTTSIIAMPFEGIREVEWLRIELIAADGALSPGLAEVLPF